MSTESTITTTTCPAWCVVNHEDDTPGGFHAGKFLATVSDAPVRMWQEDQPDARPGIVVCGQLLDEGTAHELGMALVRAADVLRRSRSGSMSATSSATSGRGIADGAAFGATVQVRALRAGDVA